MEGRFNMMITYQEREMVANINLRKVVIIIGSCNGVGEIEEQCSFHLIPHFDKHSTIVIFTWLQTCLFSFPNFMMM
jgi:hypothetical protein